MTATPSLAQNVHRLTRVHHTMNEDGGFTKQPALLDQLETATTTTGNDGGRSNEARLPINVAAVDLQLAIRKEIQTLEEVRTNQPGTTRSILYAWTHETSTEWIDTLANITGTFCERITNTINPPPRPRQLHIPCPSCGTKYAGEERKPALHADVYHPDGTMKHPNDYQVHCTECEAEWNGQEISWLTTAQAA